MRIEDLPRLDDDDREALEIGYVAIAGVLSGDEQASPPSKLVRFPRLTSLFVAVITALGLTACSLTPTQKKWAGFAAGVLVVGAIAAQESDSGKPPAAPPLNNPNLPCRPQPDGSCR